MGMECGRGEGGGRREVRKKGMAMWMDMEMWMGVRMEGREGRAMDGAGHPEPASWRIRNLTRPLHVPLLLPLTVTVPVPVPRALSLALNLNQNLNLSPSLSLCLTFAPTLTMTMALTMTLFLARSLTLPIT